MNAAIITKKIRKDSTLLQGGYWRYLADNTGMT